MAKYSSDEARWRVRMKRILRINGFDSSYVNNLETSELETIVTPFQSMLEVKELMLTDLEAEQEMQFRNSLILLPPNY